jgi:4-amino-4-deoxy-L-arabinose transferase-like glycosyltransferase
MNRRLLLVLAVSLALYGANIWGTSIYILDEAKNASCAMEMYGRGDWVVPTFNDELRTDKPPLHYYFMRVGYALAGITPFAARLFSVLMGVALVGVLFVAVKKYVSETAAFWTSLITSVSIQLAIQFHLAVPDPYLIFFLTAGLLSFYHAYASGRKKYFRLAYLAIGLATLAKGPIALAFSGLTALVFLLTQERFSLRMLSNIRILQGLLIFSLVVIPWYVLVGILTDGAWLEGFFLEHNLNRFTNTMEGHGGFPLASVVIVMVALLPFSFFAPQAIATVWKQRKTNSFLLFSFIGMFVVVVFFALSRTILPSYPEPAVPFFAVLLGYYFSRLLEAGDLPRRWGWSATLYLLIAGVIPIAVWIALEQDVTLNPLRGQAYYFVLLPIAAVVAFYFLVRNRLKEALATYATGTFVFLIVFFYWVFPQVDRLNPVSVSLSEMDTSAEVYFHKDFNPAFVFALTRPLRPWSPEAVTHTERPYYIVTQKRYEQDFTGLNVRVVHAGQDLFERQVTLVLEVR